MYDLCCIRSHPYYLLVQVMHNIELIYNFLPLVSLIFNISYCIFEDIVIIGRDFCLQYFSLSIILPFYGCLENYMICVRINCGICYLILYTSRRVGPNQDFDNAV